MSQDKLMVYDPATGANKPYPYPSHAAQWREWHGKAAWLFNPWTGERRDARDIGSDVYGHAISDGTEVRPAMVVLGVSAVAAGGMGLYGAGKEMAAQQRSPALREPEQFSRLAWDPGNGTRRFGIALGEDRLADLHQVARLMNEIDGCGNYWVEKVPA